MTQMKRGGCEAGAPRACEALRESCLEEDYYA